MSDLLESSKSSKKLGSSRTTKTHLEPYLLTNDKIRKIGKEERAIIVSMTVADETPAG